MPCLLRLAVLGIFLATSVFLIQQRARGPAYVSVVSQTLQYWSRPHTGVVPDAPIAHAAAWVGKELARTPELWRHELTIAEKNSLLAATAIAARSEKSTGTLGREDFPLGEQWETRLAGLRREVTHGLGFFVLRGVPVEKWNETEREIAYWGLGLYLGLPGAQNNDGDLLGHVRDTGGDPNTERQYKTRAEILFHCDAADAVGLLTINAARHGGGSRIVSSVSVFNRLLEETPEVVPRLFQPLPLDTRGGGGLDWVRIEPLRADSSGTLRTFYHMGYFRSAARHKSAREYMDVAALDAYERVATQSDLHLDMELQPGDLQVVSNHFILHSRTAYEDYEHEDKKRHLLRLWLSLTDEDLGLGLLDKLSKFGHRLVLLGRLAEGKIRARFG